MAGNTKIEWATDVWNPTTGCTKISPGCKNCYAERMTTRLKAMGQAKYQNAFEVAVHEDALRIPLHWRKPRRIFVDSMSDLFHEDVPNEFIGAVFGVMALCPQHRFMVLTKRPKRMEQWLSLQTVCTDDPVLGESDISCSMNGPSRSFMGEVQGWLRFPGGNDKWRWNEPEMDYHEPDRIAVPGYYEWLGQPDENPIPWPLPNVWLGVSVEDQKRADERIPSLLRCSAALHFVSCEPLLAELDITQIVSENRPGVEVFNALSGVWARSHTDYPVLSGTGRNRLGWVITGGESGPGARPSHPDWFRSLRDQCKAASVPFFFKQWGEYVPLARGITEWDHGEIPLRSDGFDCRGYEALIDDSTDTMWRVGKKAAGNKLDGRQHLEIPEVCR